MHSIQLEHGSNPLLIMDIGVDEVLSCTVDGGNLAPPFYEPRLSCIWGMFP